MKITIELGKDEIESLDELTSLVDSLKELTLCMEQHIERQKKLAGYDRRALNIQNEAAVNKCIPNEDKICGQETGDAKLPARQRILSDEEKKNLKDEEIFMIEYGLYTSFVADRYWSRVFKAIYGYSPSLLL